MRGCSVAILVLNVLDDSVCQLKDKEGRSLDYSVTSGPVHLSLSLSLSPYFSLFLSFCLSLTHTHTHTHTLSIFLALFFYFSLSLSHTDTRTHLFCAAVRIPSKSSVISWYRAPSTGPMRITSAATQTSNNTHLLVSKQANIFRLSNVLGGRYTH